MEYMNVEVSYGSQWVSLNDHEKFVLSAETRDSTSKSWRKVVADSPILGGNYLIHAVPEMVTEQLAVRVLGDDQTDLNDNCQFLDDLFFQFDYRIRWTFDEYREYWRCQLADATAARGQVWTHNAMALHTYAVPRYPHVTREKIV